MSPTLPTEISCDGLLLRQIARRGGKYLFEEIRNGELAGYEIITTGEGWRGELGSLSRTYHRVGRPLPKPFEGFNARAEDTGLLRVAPLDRAQTIGAEPHSLTSQLAFLKASEPKQTVGPVAGLADTYAESVAFLKKRLSEPVAVTQAPMPPDQARHITTAEQANTAHRRCIDEARAVVLAWFEIGAFLNRERAKCKHGEWLPWLEANIEFSQEQASIYMRMSENQAKLVTVTDLKSMSQRQLLALCDGKLRKPRQPKQEPTAFKPAPEQPPTSKPQPTVAEPQPAVEDNFEIVPAKEQRQDWPKQTTASEVDGELVAPANPAPTVSGEGLVIHRFEQWTGDLSREHGLSRSDIQQQVFKYLSRLLGKADTEREAAGTALSEEAKRRARARWAKQHSNN